MIPESPHENIIEYFQPLFDLINEVSPNPLQSQMHDVIHMVHEKYRDMNPVDEKDHLQLFLYRVKKMRSAQKEYFTTRRPGALADSKSREKQVDDAMAVLLDRLGYSTDQYEKLFEQKGIF